MTDYYEAILQNKFVDKIRQTMEFDEVEYAQLCDLLREVGESTSSDEKLEKRLVFILYSIPQMVHNSFLSFTGDPEDLPEIALKLEDAWVDLDQLVLSIFQPTKA